MAAVSPCANRTMYLIVPPSMPQARIDREYTS